jgi:hypothetical protein
MTPAAKTLADLIREDEEKAIAKTRAEIAAENAAWRALTDEQRAAINEQRDAYWRDLEDRVDSDDEDDKEEE